MEKRFKFIRARNPFTGLDDYLIADELRVKNNQITYPTQLALDGFGILPADEGMKGKLGYYFQILSQGIYGGKLRGSPQHVNVDGSYNNTTTVEPDVVDDEKNYKRDSKAVSSGNYLRIDDKQLIGYISLQLQKHPPRITFEVFRHSIKGLIENFKHVPLEEMVNCLSSNTRFMISIPFSLVLAMHNLAVEKRDEDQIPEHLSRYDGGKHRTYSKLLSSGLNPDDYNLWKLRFPEGIRMNGREIRPFPVLLARDKNHGKWVESLREKVYELDQVLLRLKQRTKSNITEEIIDPPCEDSPINEPVKHET